MFGGGGQPISSHLFLQLLLAVSRQIGEPAKNIGLGAIGSTNCLQSIQAGPVTLEQSTTGRVANYSN